MPGPDLQGRCVIVTRPTHQAEPLCDALQAAGAEAIRLPTIEIQPLPGEALTDTSAYDWLIFTSPNAVYHGLAGLGKIRSRVAAVGAATSRALNQAGIEDVLLPTQDYSSEGLLATPDLQAVSNARILLIKGQGGRPLLGKALLERGALVQERVVYKRRPATIDADRVAATVQRADSVIATSQEILQQLVSLCPPQARAELYGLQLVVPSERVVKRARDLGFEHVMCVSSPLTESALVQALQRMQPTPANHG